MKETIEVKLISVVNIKYGKGLPTKSFQKKGYPVFGANGLIGFNNTYNYKDPQVLISCRGANSGKVNMSPPECFITNNSLILEIKDNLQVEKKYLFYILNSVNKSRLVTGTAQPQVTINNAAHLLLPLPPLPIQQAIVAKLEALFSELDRGIEQLKTAQQQLSVYRQAVLKAAFEGRFTGEYVNEGELPEGWTWKKLGNLAESIKNGYSKKPDDTGTNKILRISAVRPGRLELNDFRLLKHPLSVQEEILENDLLFTRYNGSIEFVGVGARVPKLTEKFFYPDKLIRCRLKDQSESHSKYVEYAANYGKAREFVLSRIKTTAGQTGISGGELKEIPIPYPPLIIQSRIVNEIESRLSVADKLQETIAENLKQAEAFRQSILKKAFEGELV